MTRNPNQVPVFDHPDESLLFLESGQGNYSYGHLYGFTEWLQMTVTAEGITFSTDKPLLISASSTDEVIFLTAACFLLKIPFMTVREDLPEADVAKLKEQVTPALIHPGQSGPFREVFDRPVLKIPPEIYREKAAYNRASFSLSEPDDIAGLFLTSGTTGMAKIVPVKRRQVFFAARASAENITPGKNRLWLHCLPLNHVGGISIILRSLLYHSAVYRMDSYESETVKRFLTGEFRVQAVSMVPTMLVNLLEDATFKPHTEFKAILLGGGPVSIELLNKSVNRRIPIISSYGMTETFAQIAANPMFPSGGIHPPKNSVGRLFSPNELQIRDQQNEILPKGEPGRIWLKGPQVFDGYLSEELNRKLFDKQGWYDTGDFGKLNQEKYLFIESRRTDLIITGGENVNPVEVEQALKKWPEIDGCAVVGIPDKNWGQKVVAYYTGRKTIEPEEVKMFLKKNLLGFQIPREFIRIDQIPMTSLGKIKRDELIRHHDSS